MLASTRDPVNLGQAASAWPVLGLGVGVFWKESECCWGCDFYRKMVEKYGVLQSVWKSI